MCLVKLIIHYNNTVRGINYLLSYVNAKPLGQILCSLADLISSQNQLNIINIKLLENQTY